MRTLDSSPCRGNRYCWFNILSLFTITLGLTGATPWGAYAQDQRQAQQKTQQQAQSSQTGLPTIVLVPVSLDGPIERSQKDGTALTLSLRDVTKMALQANLDIAIADIKETSLQKNLITAHASYDPKFSGSFGWQTSKSLNTNAYDASKDPIMSSLSHNWSAQVSQNVRIGGGNWSFSLGGNRSDSNSGALLANPSYSANYSLNYTQPLLQNFRIDSARNQFRVINLNMKNNDITFKKQVSDTVAQIQNAYWDLVSAISSYNNAKSSLILTRTTVAQNQRKVEVGTMAPIDVLSSQSSQASQEVQLLGAEDTIISRENSLKQLITADRTADIWGKIIVPTDKPDFVEYKIDISQAIETALKKRPEMKQSDISLEQSDLDVQMQKNSQKWNLSLTGTLSGSSKGVPGCVDSEPNPLLNKCTPQSRSPYAYRDMPKFWGGLGTSTLYVFNTTPPNWQLRLSLSFPLSNRDNEAKMAQLKITRQTTLMNRSKQEQSIIVSVRNAVQNLQTTKKQIETAKIGTQLAQANLDAENKRLDAGLSQTFQVLQAQDRLSSSQSSELSAYISYRRAIVTLQQQMFTLLEESNINIGTDIPKSKGVPNLK
jgi:outer membrane protein